MRQTTETITLGARAFAVPVLTLGQIRLLLDALDEMTGKSGGALVLAAARIIEAGLARTEPGLTAEAVLAMEATLDQVNAAVAAIIRAAGLVKAQAEAGDASGEAGPVAMIGPMQGSPSSTAPSPPAAATPTR